jgi:two-component system, cell cycle response regulator
MSIASADILAASILIVDDQASNVDLLVEVLTGAGHTGVTSTMNSREVCALHRKNHYDLVVLDLQMPGMDGFQVMEGLNEIEIDGYAPILAITAQPGHKLRALASGAKDFISKPYDLVEVKTRIHNMLEMRLMYKWLKASNRELESLALHDPLTGLPNRRLVMDRLKHAMLSSARTGDHCALMFLDLDHFKTLNDTLGHEAGDLLLKQVALRLHDCVREGDTVARLGGDEFVVLLEGLSSHSPEANQQAKGVSNKILAAFADPFSLGDNRCTSSASIGVTVFKGDHEPIDKLLKKADQAMYEAKTTSRNTARFFEAKISA